MKFNEVYHNKIPECPVLLDAGLLPNYNCVIITNNAVYEYVMVAITKYNDS